MKSPWRLSFVGLVLWATLVLIDHANVIGGEPRSWEESLLFVSKLTAIVGAGAAGLVYLLLWVFEPRG